MTDAICLAQVYIQPVVQAAYRFLPCGDRGRLLENSQYTRIGDDSEAVHVEEA
jgi:hypothetical protein